MEILKRKRRTNEEFIKECIIKHNNFYTYTKTKYVKMHSKIIITCPIHGDFEQEANPHLMGQGCLKCSIEKIKDKQRDTTENFIKKSVLKHGDLFNYEKTIYGKNAHEEVTITCPIHGDFKVTPNGHLSHKVGCRICNKRNTGWSKTTWKKACLNNNNNSQLYVIECFDNIEKFIKIGITCKDINCRFGYKSQMPYNWKLITIVSSEDSDYIFNLERQIEKLFYDVKYSPKIYFAGFTECYNYSKSIINYVKQIKKTDTKQPTS